ncbi:MAG: MarR family transcriptional regulator [Bdellovibrionales bacterium]|nr:MarR family transcriptional regulator [Ramlibacter sp.]
MSLMSRPVCPSHVKALRSFNRFYTQRIGVLAPSLASEFSLTEVRVLYELAHRDQPTATELAQDLALDGGYLSRILRRFEGKKWLARAPSPADARQSLLQLTAAGHVAFAPLQQKSREEAAGLLAPLADSGRRQVVNALASVHRLLDPAAAPPATRTALLRDLKPGDLGWVVQQHGEIYATEYKWSQEFEAMVAGIAAGFIKNYQPEWERCWIAELGGDRVGSVFVVRKSRAVAQLRLLILTPQARGLGLGARLTDECLAFARAKGYKKMMLWTNSNLKAARRIYKNRGFKLTASEPYHGFGQKLVGETWELVL